jgi:hypothetical protein
VRCAVVRVCAVLQVFMGVRVRDYWYRRFVVRIWPPLAVAFIIYCLILFPSMTRPPPRARSQLACRVDC